jgi:hypothetical protein
MPFSIEEFKAWQIDHYTQRVKTARSIEERMFLRNELYNLKKKTND